MEISVRDRIQEKVYTNSDPYPKDREGRAAWGKKQGELEAQFKRDLLAEHGVTNHPKADRAFSIAWDYGHAYGLWDVVSYFEEIVELLKP